MRGVQIIYVESLCNPSSDVPDLEAVIDFAKANNLMSFIDNTFASPALFRYSISIPVLLRHGHLSDAYPFCNLFWNEAQWPCQFPHDITGHGSCPMI